MKIILTGFKSLTGRVSPSMLVVNQLKGSKIGGLEIVGAELPEDFTVVPRAVERILEWERPAVAISLAWNYPPWVKLEKIALNVMDCREGDRVIPDHQGNRPNGVPVVEGAPLAYAATLPAEEIVQRIASDGIPTFVSYAAGTHVRNAAMYSLLHWTKKKKIHTMAGQIHIPPLPGMFGPEQATMDLATEVRATSRAVEVCVGTLQSSPKLRSISDPVG